MANQETAYGLRPIGMVGSGPNSTGVTEYEIASNNTNVIYNGGIVVPLASGYIDYAGDTGGATTQALGVLTGVMYQDSVRKQPVWLDYWPGSGAVSVDTNHPVRAYVADNPNQLFQVSSDASLTKFFICCFCACCQLPTTCIYIRSLAPPNRNRERSIF